MQAAVVGESLRPDEFGFADFDAAPAYVRSETRPWQPIAKSSSARNDRRAASHRHAIGGAGCRNRTRDLLITNQLLYQLS